MPDFVRKTPDGDEHERLVCATCGFVDYQNPKIVVGSVVAADEKVMLCRRAIEPRRGFWTLPAGFMELGETVQEAAIREAKEEACADIAIDGVLGVFSIARLGQVQVMFRARFANERRFAAGPESLDVRLFDWERIPWHDIAFPSVRWTLDAWRRAGDGELGAPATNPVEDTRGDGRLTR